MKKILTGLCALSLLIAASCKKSTDNNTNGSSSKGSWQLGGATYQAKNTNSSLSGGLYEIIAFSDTTASGSAMLNIIFNNGKPSSGTYPVDTGANSVFISCYMYSNGGNDLYHSDAATGVNATVTVSGNNVKVSVPSFTVRSVFSNNPLTFSATNISLQ